MAESILVYISGTKLFPNLGFVQIGRYVGLFRRHTNILKKKKKNYIIVKELRKTIKKSMATGIAQKIYGNRDRTKNLW